MPPVSIKSSGGELEVQIIDTRILKTRMNGFLNAELAQHFIDALESWRKLGGTELQAFHDWYEVKDYESEARVLLTPWSMAHRHSFAAVHMLLRGRAMAWGVQIVNTVIGGLITAHHARPSFDMAFAAAVRGAPVPQSAVTRIRRRLSSL